MGKIALPHCFFKKKPSLLHIVIFGIVLCAIVFWNVFLIGPYSGTVVDGATGSAVKGASVLFYWTKATATPAGSVSRVIGAKLVYTDEKGRYAVPFWVALKGICTFFESTRVVVYEPGYQAHILTIWADSFSGKSEETFGRIGNLVKLKRAPADFNHKEHYAAIDNALWGIDGSAEPLKEEFLRRADWEDSWMFAESSEEEIFKRIFEEERERLIENRNRK